MKLRPEHAVMIALAIITVLVFAPGLADGFVWDDWPLIVRNELVRDPSHLFEVLTRPLWDVSSRDAVGRLAYLNLYRPVVSLAYVTEFQIFGESALGYHAVSLALHVACVLLAIVWIRARMPQRSSAAWIAAGAGVVAFALHPSRPETVTWISGCTDLWMTFWSLLGVVALMQERALVRAAGVVSIALAVLSKEAAVVVPVLLIADAWLIENRRPALRREGLAALGVVIGVAVHVLAVPPVSGEEASRGSLVARVLASFGHFVSRTLWPFSPSVEPVPHVFDAHGDALHPWWSLALGAALIVSMIALAILARARASLRPWLADALWYVLPLVPVSNVFALSGPTLVADRYLFMPLLGISALLARAALPRVAAGPPARTAVIGAAAFAAVALGATSSRHTLHFANDRELWAYELERDHDSLSAITNVGQDALAEGDVARAIEVWSHGRRVAVARHSSDGSTLYVLYIADAILVTTSDAEQDRLRAIRGFYDTLLTEGRLELTLPEIRVDERIPRDVWRTFRESAEHVYVPRATAYARTGALDEADRQLRSILSLRPRTAGAWVLYIAVAARRGDWAGAAAAVARARETLPGEPTIEAMAGALAQARAIASEPASDPIAIAIRDARVKCALGAPEAARRILDAALRESPGDPRLIMERARADVADARFDLARGVLERARASDPERAARWDEALRALSEAEAAAERRRVERASSHGPRS